MSNAAGCKILCSICPSVQLKQSQHLFEWKSHLDLTHTHTKKVKMEIRQHQNCLQPSYWVIPAWVYIWGKNETESVHPHFKGSHSLSSDRGIEDTQEIVFSFSHIIWVLGIESWWWPGYQGLNEFIYPPECIGAPLFAIETSQSGGIPGEQGGAEETAWRCSPSGPFEPCFIIFLYFERLFWNQIFTWEVGVGQREWKRAKERQRKKITTVKGFMFDWGVV